MPSLALFNELGVVCTVQLVQAWVQKSQPQVLVKIHARVPDGILHLAGINVGSGIEVGQRLFQRDELHACLLMVGTVGAVYFEL